MTSPRRQLAHVALAVTDVARATRFYTEVLGLKEIPRPDFGIAGSWLSTDGGMIHLIEVKEIPEPRDPVSHFALAVPFDQISELTTAVRHGGGTVLAEPSTGDQFATKVTQAFCCDTEGNRFELTDAG